MVILQRLTIEPPSVRTNCIAHLLCYIRYSEEQCESDNLNCLQEIHSIADLLFEICKDCAKMAALPQGAFAACKLRENYHDRDLIIARMKSNESKNQTENKKLMEYSPAKYNGKLMNAIWGIYNRYSPHNVKVNEYESKTNGYFLQQPMAVASYAIAQNFTEAMATGKEWSLNENKEN